MKRVIDISHHNTIKSWDELAARLDGVMIRIGHGVKGVDRKFEEHVEEARRVGIPFGFYLYSDTSNKSGLTDIYNEVERLQDAWMSNRSCFYKTPVAFDEERTAGVEQLEQMVSGLMRVKSTVDSVMWYTGMARFKAYPPRIRVALKSNFELWIARYNTIAPEIFCTMWQYSSTAQLSSICEGKVDANYISDAAFNNLFGKRKDLE